ncbi:glycosyltransferase [Patescibacteria group bacterium]|nr:glycosyltransferase [Patescibacteria group bacterium]
MKVLMITGDRRFGPGNERYELQKTAVEELHVLYWGKGSAGWRIWPPIPKGFDVVTVQDPFWRGLFGWVAARRIGARFNVQVHTDLSAHSFVRRRLAHIMLRRADSIRVVSEKIKKQVEQIGVCTKVSMLPIYIDLSRFRAITPGTHTSKTVLWLGRFEEEKNPLGAIEVFKKIHTSEPQVKFFMLGEGAQEKIIKEKATGLPIEFPGWADPVPYMELADVVLCTSWHESFGASIIEALAAGVPVVAPDVGVAREAGAAVVPYMGLADAVLKVLQEGTRGELKLSMPTAQEWATQWLATL